jgi:hypothetical protein
MREDLKEECERYNFEQEDNDADLVLVLVTIWIPTNS